VARSRSNTAIVPLLHSSLALRELYATSNLRKMTAILSRIGLAVAEDRPSFRHHLRLILNQRTRGGEEASASIRQ